MGLRAAWTALLNAPFASSPTPPGLEAKASRTGPLLSYHGIGRPLWTERRYDRLAQEGYARNVVAFRAVTLIARGLAAVPWCLYEGREEIERHPLLDLLKRPNPRASGALLVEALAAHYLLAGNAYLEAVGLEGAAPKELWALRPDRVRIVPGPHGLPQAFEYTAGGETVRWAHDTVTGKGPILHWKSFHPLDDWQGLSPLAAAAVAIDQHNAAGDWNQALLQNGARPSGALVYAPRDGQDSLSDEQFRRLKGEIEEQFSGAKNAGRPLLLEGGLDWRAMSLSPQDMDFLNVKLTAARDVAAAFGVPPMLVGVPGDATYANYREARLALWEDTVLPLLGQLADALNAWLVPMFGAELRLAPDLDEIPALAPRRESVWERVGKAEFLTTDEKRAAVGYGPMPEESDAASDLPPPERGRVGEGVPPEGQAFLLARALKALDDEDSERAAALLADLLAKGYPEYRPDQPRVPAGDPSGRGGRWSGGGGLGADLSGGGTDDSLSGGAGVGTGRSGGDDDYTIIPLANQSASRAPVDLLQLTDFSDPTRKTNLSPERVAQFGAAVDGLPGLTDAEKLAFVTTFFLEGDTIHGGITPETLKGYQPGRSWLPARVEDFTDPKLVPMYKVYADQVLKNVGGGARLADINDPTAAAAMFDVLFQDGGSGGTRSIQTAVNAVMNGNPPVDPHTVGLDRPLKVNGQMDSPTFEAYARLAGDPGQRDKLLDALYQPSLIRTGEPNCAVRWT